LQLGPFREHNAEMVMYTDGVKNGGAAVVIHTISCRGSTVTSSFEEEREWLKTALEWLTGHKFKCILYIIALSDDAV